MQFEYESEKLIEEVKKRPCIWDHEHPDFRSKHVKTKSWSDIVKELMSVDAVELSKSERRELEIQLQKKWKSIRDSFQKYLVKPKSKRPYIYSKQLRFLLKDKKMPEPKRKHQIQVGSSEDSDDDKPKTIWKKKKRLRIGVNDYDTDHNTEDEAITGDQNYTYEEIKPEDEIRPSETIEQIDHFAFVDAQSRNDSQPRNEYKIEYEDTDKMFLLSLLPHLKSIPEQFRLNVKVELMNVLRTAYDNIRKFGGPSS